MATEKAKKLVEELKKHGEAYALVIRGGTVVIIGPPDLRPTPLMAYNEADLIDAEVNRLIQKGVWTVSNHTGKPWTLEVYILPRV
jgi:hypothetical protein